MKALVWLTGLAALLGLGCAPPTRADEYGFIYAIHGAGLSVLGDGRWHRLARLTLTPVLTFLAAATA